MVRTDANTNPHRRAQKVRTGAGVFRPAPVGTCPAPAVEIDPLGDEIQPPTRTLDRKEAASLMEVLKALRRHADVAWCGRMNSGAASMVARFVRFGRPGCPDVQRELNDQRPTHGDD